MTAVKRTRKVIVLEERRGGSERGGGSKKQRRERGCRAKSTTNLSLVNRIDKKVVNGILLGGRKKADDLVGPRA